jgi:hypothetical protein
MKGNQENSERQSMDAGAIISQEAMTHGILQTFC